MPGLDLNQLLEGRHSLVNIGENPCDVHEAGCTHQGVVAGERQLEDLCGRCLCPVNTTSFVTQQNVCNVSSAFDLGMAGAALSHLFGHSNIGFAVGQQILQQ